MDELEFRQRVYANPRDLDQETLAAARENPEYQRILEETLKLEASLEDTLSATEIPASLAQSLYDIPANDTDTTDNVVSMRRNKLGLPRLLAFAACLLVAIGVTFPLMQNRSPSAAELAFGEDVIAHLYVEIAEIDAINSGSNNSLIGIPVINQVMANAGAYLTTDNLARTLPVRFARPCDVILPYNSAHLILEGMQGSVNVLIINNSPMSMEYRISDSRFSGLVMPLDQGNLVILGEGGEDLNEVKNLMADNIEWSI